MSPTANSHFATKGYVDGQSSSIINQFSPTLLYQTTVPLGNDVTIPAGTLTSFESRICYSIQIQNGSTFSTTSSGYPYYGFACQDTTSVSSSDCYIYIQFRNESNTTIAINDSLANEFRVYLLATNHLIRSNFVMLSYSVLSTNQIVFSSINYNVNGTNRQYLACASIVSSVTYSVNYTFRIYRW